MAAQAARNLELKVRCGDGDLDRVRRVLRDVGVPTETLRQVDTYFAATRGRLKLRTATPLGGPGAATAELIAYHRPDTAAARWSAYHRAAVPPAEAPALRAGLASALGVVAEVTKTREVGLRGRTRVHLDRVAGLGTFVELETVAADRPETAVAAELAAAAALLGLDRLEPVAGSYADLLTTAQPPAGTAEG